MQIWGAISGNYPDGNSFNHYLSNETKDWKVYSISIGQLVLYMNMILLLDLWLIIKNPFKSAITRRKEFNLNCLIVGIIIFSYNYQTV